MNNILTGLLLLLAVLPGRAQMVYTSNKATISFYSSAPLEDIKAETHTAMAAVDIRTGSVYFKVDIRSFQFRKALMQEHFNEKYMESDKFPYAEFKGNILEKPDLSRDGEYPVTVRGDLNIHGVARSYTASGMLTVKENRIAAASTFKVKLADHHIRIPKMVISHIAEVVEVTVSAVLQQTAMPNSN